MGEGGGRRGDGEGGEGGRERRRNKLKIEGNEPQIALSIEVFLYEK